MKTRRLSGLLLGLGIALAILLAASLHATDLDYSNRLGVLLRLAKLLAFAALILHGIRLAFPKERQPALFIRGCSVFGNFALAYCTSLLLVIAVA